MAKFIFIMCFVIIPWAVIVSYSYWRKSFKSAIIDFFLAMPIIISGAFLAYILRDSNYIILTLEICLFDFLLWQVFKYIMIFVTGGKKVN